MNLNTFMLLNAIPLAFEILLHLSPNKQLFLIKFLNFILDLFLEHEKSKRPLNFRCFLHKELQVGVSNACFVHAPELLDASGGQNRTFMASEHEGWDADFR